MSNENPYNRSAIPEHNPDHNEQLDTARELAGNDGLASFLKTAKISPAEYAKHGRTPSQLEQRAANRSFREPVATPTIAPAPIAPTNAPTPTSYDAQPREVAAESPRRPALTIIVAS